MERVRTTRFMAFLGRPRMVRVALSGGLVLNRPAGASAFA